MFTNNVSQFPISTTHDTLKSLLEFIAKPTASSKQIDKSKQQDYSRKLSAMLPDQLHHEKSVSLLQRIWNQFKHLLQWLLGRPITQDMDELKLRYAMNLFNNFEPSLQNSKDSGYNLPFSVALDFFCKSIKSTPNHCGMPDKKLNALIDCQSVAKELEDLKHASFSSRKSRLESLTKSLNLKIDALDDKDTIYLPGGYVKCIKSKQNDGIIPEGDCNPMIYQICKDPKKENSLVFTLFNYSTANDVLISGDQGAKDVEHVLKDINLPYQRMQSDLQRVEGKNSTYISFSIDKNELQEHLCSLLEVQIVPYKSYNLGLFANLRQKLQAIFNTSIPIKLEDISAVRLSHFFQKYKDKIISKSIDSFKHSQRTEPVKLLEIFSKSCLGHHEKFRQILQKTLLLLEIYPSLKSKLHQENVRKWLKDSILHLLNAYKKFFTLEYNHDIKNRLSKIIEEINTVEKQSAFSYPPKPSEQASSSTFFTDAIRFEQPIIKPSAFRGVKNKAADCTHVFQLPKGSFAEKLDFCKSLLNKASQDDVWLSLQYLHSSVEQLDSTGYFDKMSGQEAEVWSKHLYEMVMLTAVMHFDLNKPGPTGCQISHMLQAIKVCQKLAINNDNKTSFKSFCLDMDVIKDVLKDSYLELGSEGPKIHACLQAIEEAGQIPLDLTNPNQFDMLLPGDQQFFQHYRKKHQTEFKGINEKHKNSFLEEDFGFSEGKLAPQVVHLRSMKILTHCMLAKYRCMGSPSLIGSFKHALGAFFGALDKTSAAQEREYIKRVVNEINDNVKKLIYPIQLKKKKHAFINAHTVNIGDTQTDYIPYDKPTTEAVSAFANKRIDSQYKDMGPAIPEPMAKNVLEACVSKTEGDPVDENGTPLKPVKEYTQNGQTVKEWSDKDKTHHIATGECHTESYNLSDNQSTAELRNMQTKPFVTRIPNTFATFLRYPNLLGNAKDFAAWQWIFSLNLFRNNALACYLKEKPEHVSLLIKHLTRLSTIMEAGHDVRGLLFIAHLSSQIRNVIIEVKLFSPDTQSELNNLLSQQNRKIANWMKSCDNMRYKPHTRAIHETFLLVNAELLKTKLADPNYDPLADAPSHGVFLKLLHSYFVTQRTPQPFNERNFAHEECIVQMMHRLFPIYEKLLADPAVRSNLLDQFAPGNPNSPWLATNEFLCYQKDAIKIDLQHGLLFMNNVASGPLPDLITHDPLCYSLFGSEKIHNIQCKHSHIRYEGITGDRYEFHYQDKHYCVFVLPDRKPLIYKEMDLNEKQWCVLQQPLLANHREINLSSLARQFLLNPSEVKLPNTEEKNTLPQDLFHHYCWASTTGDDFLIEDVDGVCVYKGKFTTQEKQEGFEVKHIHSLSKLEGTSFISILNPWKNTAFERFLALCPSNQLLAKSSSGNKIEEVKYLNFKFDYKWNQAKKCWDCLTIPGYFLSSKKIETLFLTSAGKRKDFFDENFCYYHLLEHPTPTKPARLILPFQEFKKSHNSKENPLLKSNQSNPIPADDTSASFLYQYSVDQLGTVKGSPEGYLYLAYILYTQSKYEQATYYLKKAQDIKPEQSVECQRILEWIHKWDASTPEAKIFMMHVDLLILNQSPSIEKTPKLNRNQKQLLLDLLWNYDVYFQKHYHEAPYHNLSGAVKSQIEIYRQIMNGHLAEFDADIMQHFSSIVKVRNIHDHEVKNHGAKLTEIKSEIDSLRASLITGSQHFKSSGNREQNIISIPVFPKLQGMLTDGGQTPRFMVGEHRNLSALEDQFKAEQKGVSFPAEIGSELSQDIWRAVQDQQSEKNVLSKVEAGKVVPLNKQDIDNIEKQLSDNAKALINEMRNKKDKIMQSIKIALPESKELLNEQTWDTIIKELKEQSDYFERLFSALLYVSATNDWKDWVNLNHMLTVDNKDAMNKLVREYLSTKTLWQQHVKTLDLIHQYKINQSPKLMSRLGELLAAKRCYNPDNDPNAVAILLLESELGVIARKNQIDHYLIMINELDILKHEGCGTGKTSLLRNLIADYKANGSTLSCVITHEPLISIHHRQLETAASEAYGAKAYRFEFNRQNPTDKFSLYLTLRNLLKIIMDKGRLDFTPNDILSLHHAFLLKNTELENPVRDVKEIHDEIDILAEIIQTFKDFADVYSDEIDKILEANKQHNYSIGKPQKINSVKSQAGMQITEWVLSDTNYYQLFKSNQLWTKSQDRAFIQRFLENMAVKIFDQLLQNGVIKEQYKSSFIQYLTQSVIDDPDLPQKQRQKEEIDKFREEVINKLPEDSRVSVKAYHKFLQKIIPASFGKRNGLHYIRSDDGVLVKPVSKNGVCNELSEFSSEEESIWYTCLNYMHANKEEDIVGGVTEEQIAQLVLDARHQSSLYILNNIKENHGFSINYNETPTAAEFKQNFGLNLDCVVPEHYANIADTLNNNPQLLIKFLNHYVFPKLEISPQQIVGTPHHCVPMVKHFSGSTGTSNIYRSLPKKINAIEKYYKQPGVDGAVYLALIQDFKKGVYKLNDPDAVDEGQTFVVYDETKGISQQFAQLLQKEKGSTLIDCAPAFPGMTADKITESLAKNMPNARLRFTDKDDREIIFDTATASSSPEGEFLLEDAHAIMDNAQKRGTHKELPDLSTGYVPINKLTTLSDFTQSAMRMRKFGKGQKIRIAIDRQTYEYLKENPTLVNFIRMLCNNEAEYLKTQHHDKSEVQMIRAWSENAVYDELVRLNKLPNVDYRKLREQIWSKSKSFFIKDTQEPLEELDNSVLKPTPTVRSEIALYETKQLEALIHQLTAINPVSLKEPIARLEQIRTELTNYSQQTKLNPQYFSHHMSSNRFNIDMLYSVQKDLQINADKEQESELHKENLKPNYKPFVLEWKGLNISSLDELLVCLRKPELRNDSGLHQLQKHVPFYDSNLFFTHNVYRPEQKILPWGVDKTQRNLPDGLARINKLAIAVDRSGSVPKVYGIAGSLIDFDEDLHAFDKQAKDSSKLDYYVCNIFNNDELEGYRTRWEYYDADTQEMISKLIVQAKLLGGEIYLQESDSSGDIINQQFTTFKDWLFEKCKKFQLNASELEKNLLSYLLTRRASLLEQYDNSRMAKAFQYCKKQ